MQSRWKRNSRLRKVIITAISRQKSRSRKVIVRIKSTIASTVMGRKLTTVMKFTKSRRMRKNRRIMKRIKGKVTLRLIVTMRKRKSAKTKSEMVIVHKSKTHPLLLSNKQITE